MITDENIMSTELLAMNVSQGIQLRIGLAFTNACDSDGLPPRLRFSPVIYSVIKLLDVPGTQRPLSVLDIPI